MSIVKISILTLSFNQAEFLEESLNSVLLQNYTNWELIILDPGSSDSSREIATRYASLDTRIRTNFENDNGPSDGLNKGLALSTGDVIGCLNADDYYRLDIFDEVINAFRNNREADCIYSHGSILESGRITFQTSDKFSVARYFSNRGLVLQQSTFFRKSSLDRLGVKFNVENRTSWDGEFILNLASRDAKFKKVFGNWGVFRIYSSSITGSQRLKEKSKLDHQRMYFEYALKDQVSLLIYHFFLLVPFYSLYRRARNFFYFLIWRFLNRLGVVK